MTVNCPICSRNKEVILLEKRLNLYKCNYCLHTFTNIIFEEQEEYNDKYFLETHKNWFANPNYKQFDFIYNKFMKLLDNEQIQLLDVGCGKGEFLRYIAEKDSRAKLFGIDLTNNEHQRIHFIKGDFLKEKFRIKFNVICSFAVIEHIENLHLFVKKLNDLLQSNGFLFITTININSLMYRIAKLLNKLGFSTAHDRLYSAHHLQHYTNQSLKKLMEMNGFTVFLQKNHNYPIKAVDVPSFNYLVEKIYKFFVWLIFLLSKPLNLGIHQTIMCKKKIF